MPRVITSRSLDNLSSKGRRFLIVSKRELKKQFLEEVLLESQKTEAEKLAEQAKVKALLAKLK